ncbi:hypothetical protein FNV43_RR08763 [Rhamnella rubrinervis]|uniref:non-specific serine/threonine protein kinase n=1 Tax=Rhamnella rubrinervis TaxID=2594499 RepID=A0A8K0MJN6_9ROSA|nr:hypothetical protein FNV43_RR08763 [Rhamnella rubrinervis]
MAVLAVSYIFLLFFLPSFGQSQPDLSFTFNGFSGKDDDIEKKGATIIKPTGLLRLNNKSNDIAGHAFYSKPINMFSNSSSSSKNVSSFSTSFVFSMVPSRSSHGGFGIAFTIAPSTQFLGAEAGHFLGLFNSSSNGKPWNHIFLVEFDTVNGFNGTSDSTGNHVGVNTNGMDSAITEPAAYFDDDSDSQKEDVNLENENGDPVRAWIEYDGVSQMVYVTIAPSSLKKPAKPLISRRVDLNNVLKDTMYVGFAASTGKTKSSSHYILGWSFAMNKAAPELNLTLLPKPPKQETPSSSQTKVLIILLSSFVVVLMVMLCFLTLYKRLTPTFEILEDWELDCPHRFKFKDLYHATKGFKASEVIGVGGFGAVYKGVLPSTGLEVAVKKITRNSLQGIRDFAAEVESLGQLRHKNLVNLQGWCKQKNNLIIVYDYIPYGSLDSLIFNPRDDNVFLGWEHRFNIFKGIAEGLLYLHEEYQQVVIHRDVKSSNVLIDSDMNARLSDFGLARLHDHNGEISHTTGVVGTIGYIAPELARTGKASTSTDVFAYGVLLLEVACGRRPIGSGQFILVDWVMECYRIGRLLDAVDPKLGSNYNVEEMELVMKLGLICSHQRPEARPSMRQVVRYLSGDDLLPGFDEIYWSPVQSMNSRYMEAISNGTNSASYNSSSIGGGLSFNSMSVGR